MKRIILVVVFLSSCIAFKLVKQLRKSVVGRHKGETYEDFDVINDDVRVGGMPLFQGDMVMTEDMLRTIVTTPRLSVKLKIKLLRMWRRYHGKPSRPKRAAVKSSYRIWGDGSEVSITVGKRKIQTYGVIPYIFDEHLPHWKRRAILEAINHWEAETATNSSLGNNYCIKFIPWTDQGNYVKFTDSQGCWSSVGKNMLSGPQIVSLGPRCSKMGLIAHELGHALGFFHEQSRPDRDKWIKVIDENVKRSREFNFIKYNTYIIDTRNVDYDYGSIMHYRLDAFSRNGLNTIRPLKKTKGVTIGQREKISKGDALQIMKMYGCPNRNHHTSSPNPTTTEEASTTEPELGEIKVSGHWIWDYKNSKWVWMTD